jgi:hypothetical protein
MGWIWIGQDHVSYLSCFGEVHLLSSTHFTGTDQSMQPMSG